MSLDKGFEKVQRALKILADKGVQPLRGPIKSTLLQLDSTFSERDFGVSSFREFIQKLADKRLLSMKRIDQGYLVESTSDSVPERAPESSSKDEAASEETPEAGKEPAATAPASAPEAPAAPASTEPIPPEEGLKLLGQAAANLAEKRSGKPVYVRHLAQELRAIVGEFDESRFGFRTLTEMAHEAQKAGLLSMQRDRVGAWRVTATSGGNATAEKSEASSSETESKVDEAADAATNDASPAGADAEEKEAAATPARTGTKKTAAKKAAAKKTAAKKTTSKATTKKATTKKATTKKTTAKKAGTKKAATKKTTAKKAATKKADDSDS
jgi:ribonuclease E